MQGLGRSDVSYAPDLATLGAHVPHCIITRPRPAGMINRLERVSLTNDLAFDVYQDKETAAVIRSLAQQKVGQSHPSRMLCGDVTGQDDAIRAEDYLRAGYLKNTLATLQQACHAVSLLYS